MIPITFTTLILIFIIFIELFIYILVKNYEIFIKEDVIPKIIVRTNKGYKIKLCFK